MGLLFVLICVLLLPSIARAQDTTRPPIPPPADTSLPAPRPDSIVTGVGGGSDLDEPIIYDADYIRFNLDRKKAYLTGNASVQKGSDRLRAHYIEVDFETEELYAESRLDSATGDYIGVPLLDYDDQQLSALTLKYNFKTGRGVSSAAELAIEQGFLKVERFKKVSDDVIFAQNGVFTTCDALDPHYFFKASKMKLEGSAAIYADRLQMYIEDVPVVTLPVGFFFMMNGGRHSGIILPDIDVTETRGVELNGLGYFWIINDYLDATFTTDLTSKGGYNLRNRTRFRLRDIVEQSDIELTFGRGRPLGANIDDPLQNSYAVEYDLRMLLGENTRIGGHLEYATQDAYRRTSTQTSYSPLDDENDIATQEINSNFNISTRVGPISYSFDYRRNQNITTQEINPETFTVAVKPDNWTPFSRSGIDILQSLTLGLNPRYQRAFTRSDTIGDGEGFRTVTTKQGISIGPSISMSPKLSYFTFSPSINLNSSLFFRRSVLQPNEVGTFDTTTIEGLYAPFWYSFGGSVRTTLYGIIQPRIFGINAIRHMITPQIGFSFQPDFSDPKYGYYDEFFDPTANRIRPYSIFIADQGVASFPGIGAQRSLTYDIQNVFEAKIARGDTLEDQKVRLLDMSLSGRYNFADSLRPFSPINASASTNLGRIGSVNLNATFDPYRNDTSGRFDTRGIHLPFPYVRVTDATLSFRTSFSNAGFNDYRYYTRPDTFGTVRKAHVDRHGEGFNREEFYGERVRGNAGYRIPWNVSLSGTFTLIPLDTGGVSTKFSVNTTFDFSVTPTTKISAGGYYDVINGAFELPSIRLTKDLHDWEMLIEYVPGNGYGQGIRFSIGFTPSLLRDLRQDFRF